MEEGGGSAVEDAFFVGINSLPINSSQMAGADVSNVDLVGKLKIISAGRKKLMTKYFNLEEEGWPLLSEYFAVALAFVALGAMIREANVRLRKKEKEGPEGVLQKLRRMALDAMLKSAMERLRGLARRTQTLEEKVRDRSHMEAAFQFERLEFLKRINSLEATIARDAEAEAAWLREKEDLNKRVADADSQRGYFFKKMGDAEVLLGDLQRLRAEDGKANAKLVGIYAGREQSWKSERIKMKHEIEFLKDKVSKLVLQAQIKASHSYDTAAEALKVRNLKRRAKEFVREKVVSERETSALVGVEQSHKSELDWSPPKEYSVSAEDLTDYHEGSAYPNQDMEAELAIILQRVGALKKRGTSGSKFDELLNEAAGKPLLKRLGSFDAASRAKIVDDFFERRPELSIARDVGVDNEGGEDIWQALGVQESKYVQGSYCLVDAVTPKREPVRRSLLESTGFTQGVKASNSPEALKSKLSADLSAADDVSERHSHTEEGSSVANQNLNLNTTTSEDAAVSNYLSSEQKVCTQAKEIKNLDSIEARWVDSTDYGNDLEMEFEGYTITSEPDIVDIPVSSPGHGSYGHSLVNSLSLSEDGSKNEISTRNSTGSSSNSIIAHLEDVQGQAYPGAKEDPPQPQTSALKFDASQIDTNAELGLGVTAKKEAPSAEESTGGSGEEVLDENERLLPLGGDGEESGQALYGKQGKSKQENECGGNGDVQVLVNDTAAVRCNYTIPTEGQIISVVDRFPGSLSPSTLPQDSVSYGSGNDGAENHKRSTERLLGAGVSAPKNELAGEVGNRDTAPNAVGLEADAGVMVAEESSSSLDNTVTDGLSVVLAGTAEDSFLLEELEACVQPIIKKAEVKIASDDSRGDVNTVVLGSGTILSNLLSSERDCISVCHPDDLIIQSNLNVAESTNVFYKGESTDDDPVTPYTAVRGMTAEPRTLDASVGKEVDVDNGLEGVGENGNEIRCLEGETSSQAEGLVLHMDPLHIFDEGDKKEQLQGGIDEAANNCVDLKSTHSCDTSESSQNHCILHNDGLRCTRSDASIPEVIEVSQSGGKVSFSEDPKGVVPVIEDGKILGAHSSQVLLEKRNGVQVSNL